jgi:hypothetical protein
MAATSKPSKTIDYTWLTKSLENKVKVSDILQSIKSDELFVIDIPNNSECDRCNKCVDCNLCEQCNQCTNCGKRNPCDGCGKLDQCIKCTDCDRCAECNKCEKCGYCTMISLCNICITYDQCKTCSTCLRAAHALRYDVCGRCKENQCNKCNKCITCDRCNKCAKYTETLCRHLMYDLVALGNGKLIEIVYNHLSNRIKHSCKLLLGHALAQHSTSADVRQYIKNSGITSSSCGLIVDRDNKVIGKSFY